MQKAVVERFVSIINTHDLTNLAEVIAHDVTEEGPIVVDAPAEGGIAAFRTGWEQMLSSFPDIHVALDGMVEEGDTVAARITLRATGTGFYRRAEATGRPAEWTGFVWVRLRDGKIVYFHGLTDRFGVLQQLGFIGSDDELAAKVNAAN
ncbi:ester cyclase [Actinocrispum wychmicini]|uniref:SnoaL-like polyketide cyclase n=1 Tax=Actinocrispum wychmicini TaxID=1213861 RepID=A0A4R2K6A0_9PSEU|nr:ester cyclase [Actinocrispum wychmicini]TCO65436.1 SnoaL-like polyketide cyclase [Actinocrispum wychmicini]